MAGVDFARLRMTTMNDGQDSEVTVNTRALIDKVLARYSSEHTTLRELIQNASDAGASTVIIRFDTDPSLNVPAPQTSDKAVLLKHIIQHHTLKRLIVSNNGQPFSTADWSRLKSIADGNPDETKIGAFGVGFYSVFADCDEPFVVSGDRTMAFYWKGNTLSTKIATFPSGQATSNTTFSLDYRQANPATPSYNPSKIPNLPTLCQFLATSLTFVGLQSIELHVDDVKVTSFTKKISPPSDIQVPQGLRTETEGGLMRVKQVTRQHSQIDAEWKNVIATAQDPPKRAAELVHTEVRNAGSTLKSFFSKFASQPTPVPMRINKPLPAFDKTSTYGDDMSGDSKGTIFLQVFTVEVETRVSRSFAAEIERATKKPPPRKTKIALLTSPYHDPSTSLSLGSGTTAELASKVFAEILPTNAGRIFIGFPTAQTTGFLAHISAPSLIPTVERENVDMNARYISTWNIELLRVAGLACRISYASEMATIKEKVHDTPIAALIPQAVYTFQQYTANASHPSTLLGETIEEAFWNCSKERTIDILSSKGILPSRYVRMPAETLSFLGEVPMVPQELATGAVTFMVKLHERGFISELTMADIRQGLESRALNEEELMEFLKWCGAKIESKEIDALGVHSLFDITVANIGLTPGDTTVGKILQLGNIKTYVNASRITPTLPTPPDTVPFAFSKSIPPKQLQMFGWTELSMVRWLQFMTTAPLLQELVISDKLASQVLGLTAKSWDQLDGASKEAIINILTPHTIMPTKMGMRRPQDAYFPTVKLFEDLPTVKPFTGSKDKFLQALGVRKTVDLPMVFDRMRTQDPNQAEKALWNHEDLIRYFASVMDELPKKDLDRLRLTPFLPGEGQTVQQGQLFKAEDLYAPDQAILSLGLTQVKLPFEFRPNTREGMLLVRLGLKQWPGSPTIATILHHAGKSNDRPLYTLAMEYFLQNHYRHGYAAEIKQLASITQPILPTEQVPFPTLVAPFQCFTNEHAACLGYPILRSDIRPHADKFGIQRDPDIKDCIQKLLKQPPRSKTDAEMQFAYLASRSGDLDQHQSLMNDISFARIVPVFRKFYIDPDSSGFEDHKKQQTGKAELRIHHYDPPETVFVGRDQDYKGILDYVQYGPEATSFLLKVGAKHEPSSHDLAMLLSKNPSKFLNTIGHERYLDLLRKLADHAGNLWKDKNLVRTLVASPILLGYKDIKMEAKKLVPVEEDDFEDLEDSDVQREWSLNKADQLVIIDEVHHYTKFRDYVIATPQDDLLEEFYSRFGVKKISDLVKKDQRVGVIVRDQSPAIKLKKDILERVRLFLHEYERDGSSKSIRHDGRWLASSLSVQCVADITIRYSLADRGVATSEHRTAAEVKLRGTGHTLYVTPKYDIYQVSRELVRLILSRPKQNDVIALERILTESLRRLQEKGINVERILRRKEYEARIAKQQELEREHEEQQRLAEQPKSGLIHLETAEPPGTPEKGIDMPGAFGSPENNSLELADNHRSSSDRGVFNNWARKLGLKNTPSLSGTDGPQINRDIQATRTNIQNAIKECRPTNMQVVKSKHHQDPTELDNGGYCTGEQWENLYKAFTIPYSGRHVDIYFGKHQIENPKDLQEPLSAFLPLVFGLASIFGVDPAAVSIFLDNKSNTVAFNLSGSLFFNLAWFMALHHAAYGTREGRLRALDSWFLTFSHELAHNLVADHNARHSWYQQQIAIEYSQSFRAALQGFTQGL
ncbi:uncharacterized protein BDR25DRAFT_260988 [Lindgomyces ingoldianus]|uniref:Uncharacterized protein n=1 Tax=Lindgomyces ingoldianus TaxID=673940 RepID=A0ACB6QWZ7_9PLEO|nr:uncharacterized protein BDR25DRAFT_260988 [Lindgomyces ingoldianus]KAF2471436.1 hypothetical protein BDR25DRAFT_260988 [Lindgomyces ingoldianus]